MKNNLLCFAFLLLAGALILTNHKALVFKSAKWALCTRGVLNLNVYSKSTFLKLILEGQITVNRNFFIK